MRRRTCQLLHLLSSVEGPTYLGTYQLWPRDRHLHLAAELFRSLANHRWLAQCLGGCRGLRAAPSGRREGSSTRHDGVPWKFADAGEAGEAGRGAPHSTYITAHIAPRSSPAGRYVYYQNRDRRVRSAGQDVVAKSVGHRGLPPTPPMDATLRPYGYLHWPPSCIGRRPFQGKCHTKRRLCAIRCAPALP